MRSVVCNCLCAGTPGGLLQETLLQGVESVRSGPLRTSDKQTTPVSSSHRPPSANIYKQALKRSQLAGKHASPGLVSDVVIRK